MFAALTGMAQATFASEVQVADGKLNVTREVDGGLQTISIDLPAVITTDLRLNEPRYASLPNIMKAKRKPMDTVTPEELGVDISPRLEILSVEPPEERQAGIKVENVEELVDKLRNEAEGDFMSTLVVAEHDNQTLKPVTLVVAAAAEAIGNGFDVLVAGSGCGAVAAEAAAIAGANRVLLADNGAYEHQLAENIAPLVAEVGASYGHILTAHTTTGKNFLPRGGGGGSMWRRFPISSP